MGNTIDWGQAAVNNTIGFGDGAENNTIGWGDIQADSWSPETNLTGTGGTPAFTNTLSTTFDGVDDLVSMGNVLTMANDGTDAYSVSLWFKTTNTTTTEVLISKQKSTAWYNGFSLNMRGDLYIFQFNLGTLQGSAYIAGKTNAIYTINDGNWHHITLSYDGSQDISGFTLYYDGVSQSIITTSNNTPTGVSNTDDFMIGARGTSASSALRFTGNIDESSYFNTELSQTNVTDIYNLGTPTDISAMSGLVSWWRMGDGSTYPTITDNVGSNDGTMTFMSAANFVTDVPT